MRRPCRKGRAACRAPGHAGSALAPRPLRGRRTSRVKGKGVCRLAVTEAPIDALSLAAIKGVRPDTLYLAMGGGIGPGTVAALHDTIRAVIPTQDARLVAATDANRAGDCFAERLTEIASEAGMPVERLRPIGAIDWNDILQGRAE